MWAGLGWVPLPHLVLTEVLFGDIELALVQMARIPGSAGMVKCLHITSPARWLSR